MSYTAAPWLLFVLIVALLIAVPVALSAEQKVEIECDATHCIVSKQDLLTIIEYVKRLEKLRGKSCT